MQEDMSFYAITQLCANNGFYKRRNAFFKVNGDGILQVLQYKKVARPYPHVSLDIGLVSLYGEIDPLSLTPSRCAAKYQTHWLEPGVREEFRSLSASVRADDMRKSWCYAVNVEFAEHVIIPYLDRIKTQHQLVNELFYLDKYALSFSVLQDPLWNDFNKYAPFLHSGNLEMALKVITSIIDQHESAKEWRRKNWSVEQYEEYLKQTQEEDNWLIGLKLLAESADQNAINEYLKNNYKRNLELVEPFNKKAKK